MTASAWSLGSITAIPIATLKGRQVPWKQNSQLAIIDTSRFAVSEARGLVRALEQDSELVAAEPRHAVALANALGQHVGDLDQGLVPGLVAERVVDHLEAVDVDEQHRRAVVVAADPVDRAFELVQEPAPVGKVDEDVLIGETVEQLHALVQLRDLAPQPPDFSEQRVRIGHFDDHIIHGSPEIPLFQCDT